MLVPLSAGKLLAFQSFRRFELNRGFRAHGSAAGARSCRAAILHIWTSSLVDRILHLLTRGDLHPTMEQVSRGPGAHLLSRTSSLRNSIEHSWLWSTLIPGSDKDRSASEEGRCAFLRVKISRSLKERALLAGFYHGPETEEVRGTT